MQLHRNQQQNAGDYVSDSAQDPSAQSRGYGRGTSAMGEPTHPSYQTNAGDNPPQSGGTYPNRGGSYDSPPSGGAGASAVPSSDASNPPDSQTQPSQAADDAHPYVQTTSAPGGESKSPMDSLMQAFGKWGKKAEDMSGNVWGHLRTGPNMADTARGRMAVGAKAFSEGGMGNVYRQSFDSAPDEHLLKTFACYLSTSSGLVPGTLFITSQKLAFCSDRPLAIPASPTSDDQSDPADKHDKHGKRDKRDKHSSSKKASAAKDQQQQQEMLYYKVTAPISQLQSVQPSENAKKKPPERYIQVTTVDGHEFWFMGFVNYEKGVRNLQDTLSSKERSAADPSQAAAMGSTESTNVEYAPATSKSPGATDINGPSGNRDFSATDGYNPADANSTGDRDFQSGNNGNPTIPGDAYADPASATTGQKYDSNGNPNASGDAYADPASTAGDRKDANMSNLRSPSATHGSEYANNGNSGYRTRDSDASDNNYVNPADPASTTTGPPPQNNVQ